MKSCQKLCFESVSFRIFNLVGVIVKTNSSLVLAVRVRFWWICSYKRKKSTFINKNFTTFETSAEIFQFGFNKVMWIYVWPNLRVMLCLLEQPGQHLCCKKDFKKCNASLILINYFFLFLCFQNYEFTKR